MTWTWNGAFTTNSCSSGSGPTLQQAMEAMERIMAKERVRQSETYFAILQMDPCGICGVKVEYREGPPESFAMCKHFLAHLKSQCKEPPKVANPGVFGIPDMIGMMGIEVIDKN